MIPQKKFNIYPKSEENFKALISYYFDSYEIDNSESIEFLNKKTSMTLNQIEFVLRKVSEAYYIVFKNNLNDNIKLTNLMAYGFDTLTLEPKQWKRSLTGIKIMEQFLEFVQKTESNIK
ncbi:MAG: hypothetical protein U0V72_01365 [Cytophagales bacterium]